MLSWFKLNLTPISLFSKQVKYLSVILLIMLAGCSLQKESGLNRNLQNLTAHYNILFNAREILRIKQESYALTFVDNYNELLNVYQDTIAQSTTPDKDLENAIAKANTIISVKEQSHYLGDAYLVLGKAYFLEGNYFNATEYFGYVVRSYPKRTELTQEALTWQARSLMYLNELPQARVAIDSAIENINPKKKPAADIFATKLQYDINVQDYNDAEAMATKAVYYCREKVQRLRWTFILAQLQELNHKPAEAFANYNRVAGSNAAFEMSFNAAVNRIRIQDNQNGIKQTRQQRLLSLLKDPNNKEFKDQIYYQVAELYLLNKDIDNAVKNYKLSVRNTVSNQNQKGLAYLRLAQINFKNKADYISAKKYYDSTLTTLSPNYPGYRAIQKIGTNLQLLADRLQIITREDTLQALARMDELARLKVIDKMVNDRILQQQAALNTTTANINAVSNQGITSGNVSGSTFYFYNANAVSLGYADFKKRWGNRKLEDNWRRSSRDNSDITNNQALNLQGGDPDAPVEPGQTISKTPNAGNYRQELMQGIPLTPAQLAQSNLRIYNASVDVANFYRDVLDDKKEAIAEYELILKRFPDNPSQAATYYNLYRLYSTIDPAKSELYKNKVLREYPETPFAKVITDPDYFKKLDDKDTEFTQAYNQVFDLYLHKQYKDVIARVPVLVGKYPNNRFAAQLYYLKTIAEGHNERAQPFVDSLQKIAKKYPDDRLVTPLINQHLAYISQNSADIMSRPVVLADEDPHDIPFTLDNALKEQTAYRRKAVPYDNPPQPEIKKPEPKKPDIAKLPEPPQQQTAAVPQPVTAPKEIPNPVPVVVVKKDTTQAIASSGTQVIQPVISAPVSQQNVQQEQLTTIFTLTDSTNYYFIVNVSSSTTNLASSRFGIGQFNRVNYTGKGIRHLVKPIGNDAQLIYVGRFSSLDDVKKYARQIIPLMPDIMKVPNDKYSFFIITQENLNKLADKKTLDSYINYYQKNY